MREIIFDTETTGLDKNKDRIIEIGCLESINKNLTGKKFHVYINPADLVISADAVRIHGLTNERLKDEPLFKDIVQDFLEFIQDSVLVAHNGFFDLGFLNAELERLSLPQITPDRMLDTLALARRKHGYSQNSLDALCRRYGIDNSHRTLHGALLDAEILFEVYLELTDSKQGLLFGREENKKEEKQENIYISHPKKERSLPMKPRLNEEQKFLHNKHVREKLGKNALWNLYL